MHNEISFPCHHIYISIDVSMTDTVMSYMITANERDMIDALRAARLVVRTNTSSRKCAITDDTYCKVKKWGNKNERIHETMDHKFRTTWEIFTVLPIILGSYFCPKLAF